MSPVLRRSEQVARGRRRRVVDGRCTMRIWVDLTNSPHVLVMRPVIAELRARGHEVEVTARDFAQTLGLLQRFGIEHTADRPPPRRRAGGEGRRARGALAGAGALGPRRAAFELALGHGSNDITVAAALLRIPSRDDVRLRVGDGPAQRQLPAGAGGRGAGRDPARAPLPVRRARQDPRLPRAQGGVLPGRLRARPGGARRARPRRARSRSPSSAPRPRSRSITASRTTCSGRCSSACAAARRWCFRGPRSSARRCSPRGGLIVPERAIDAQSLIAYADLVVSAGGTMNREAVALGTPVYTVFEGRLGAVDERLIAEGRLRQLRSAEQVELVKRVGEPVRRATGPARPGADGRSAAVAGSLTPTHCRGARRNRPHTRHLARRAGLLSNVPAAAGH